MFNFANHFNTTLLNITILQPLKSACLNNNYPISLVLSFTKFLFQILLEIHTSYWILGQYYSSSKRFNCIDGLQDAFIKDKVIDIMTYFSNQYDLTYTLNNNYASVCCKPEIFSKLIQFIACRNIDILSATYKARALHNARI